MAYKADNDWLEMLWIVVLFISSAATAITSNLIDSILGFHLFERIGELWWIAYLILFAAYILLLRYRLLYKKFEAAKNDPYFGIRGGDSL
jgi:hypothetical protein